MTKTKIESIQAALNISPENVPLLNMLGVACLEEGDFLEARSAYDNALSIDPKNTDAKLGIIKILVVTNKVSEGYVRAESVLKEVPECAAAWLLLSKIHIKEDNVADGKKCYERAIRFDASLSDPELENELYLENPTGFSGPTPTSISNNGNFRQKGPADEGGWESGMIESQDALAQEVGHIEKPQITFSDVGGMEGLKEEIRMKIMYPLQNPDLFRAYGKKIGGGVLIYGPPGCGKTLVSKATAGEIKAKFISVGIHEILDLWIGNSEKNMHQLFELARADAPSVLFFDEVDALAADRRHMKHSGSRSLINQFLAEMDGTQGQNDGVLVIGATNAPWHIDSAFRRPGRFDRILFVPPPDSAARAAIIEILGKGKPIKGLNSQQLAQKTDNFSGADLHSIFDITIEHSLAQAMKENKIIPITTKELVRTAKSIKPSTKSWFETARNYALYSNQNGIYDGILEFLNIKK